VKLRFILLFLLVFGKLLSQSTDSLLHLINSPKLHDTTKFYAYYELGWQLIYSNPDSTFICAKKAFVLAKNNRQRTQQAKALNLMGAYFQIKSEYRQAIDYYQKSLKLALTNNDPNAVLVAYGNIGSLFILLGDNKKALDYQLKSLSIAIESGAKEKLGSIYNNLCLIYYNLEEFEKSIEYGKKSYAVYNEFNDKNGICSATGNLGNVYMRTNNNALALEYYTTCYTLAKEIDNQYELSRAAADIASILTHNKEFKKAKKFLEEAEEIAEESENDALITDIYEQYYQLYKASGNITEALKHLEIFHKLKDKLSQEEKKSEFARKEMEFEFNIKVVQDSIKNAEEVKLRDLKLQTSKAQIEKDRILKIALSTGLILVIVLVLLVFSRFRTTRRQKQIIELKSKQTEEQKTIIENKNKEILDSINYAKRIQYALLAHDDFLKENLPEHFVIFKPKDIVSGDFYWATSVNAEPRVSISTENYAEIEPQLIQKSHYSQQNYFYLAVCDSTGHGVPGAFMSLLNIGFLGESILEKKITRPHEIFNFVRNRLIESISRDEQKDGFDGILLCFDKTLNKITYVAANNRALLISKEGASTLAFDKMPVGKGENVNGFNLRELIYAPGDTLYLFTDGYADQFGGPQGKKFKYRQLEGLLSQINEMPMHKQKDVLETKFAEWKGELEQVDDVCVIGLRL
jgi:serine phosphatase RsbU (regulator of sigma subunit)